ncbi:hypothetical protein ACIRSU_25720 [Streptomyces sp. NPDC101160]|uniref:hypothetical protein n=1 Tax=Streptomyces sp. NPDC101160 TaxID=3366118 RepID=UPI003808DC66
MKTVEFHTCECSDKRAFADERAADKALGRAQAKRDRTAERRGQRRAIERENRIYQCDFGMWHLTKQSRRSFEGRTALYAA